MYKKGDLVKHCVFHELRGVIIKESQFGADYLSIHPRMLHYRVWWSDGDFTDEPSFDIELIEDKQNV